MAKTTQDKEHETWMKALRAEAKPADRDRLINAARANLSPNKFEALLKAWGDEGEVARRLTMIRQC